MAYDKGPLSGDSVYDEATINKMWALVTEMRDKLRQATILQDELAWMLYAVRQDPSMTIELTAANRRVYNEQVKKRTASSKLEVNKVLFRASAKEDAKWAFCRSIDTLLWHIRKLTKNGKMPEGHILAHCDTRSLCNTPIIWDEFVQVTEENMKDNGCLQCSIEYRRLQGEDYVNGKKD